VTRTRRPPWEEDGWLDESTAWIQAQLDSVGVTRTGEIEEHHVRPWSIVLRVPTADGGLYFKAATPAQGHEAAVTDKLAQWFPDDIPRVLAADHGRSWLLMTDGGQRLREAIVMPADLDHWDTILPRYVHLQREVASRLPDLLTLGLPDRRLARLPPAYETLLADKRMLRIDQPDGLTRDQYRRLCGLARQVAADCEALAAFGIPLSIDHSDFHDGNVFVRDGRYMIGDWADSVAAHPFSTMLVMLRMVAWRLDLKADAPEVLRLRDLYLGQWSDYGPRHELQRAFELAYRLGFLLRALTWHTIFTDLESRYVEPYADAVPGWLAEYLEVVG
jgi:hypothetical protein